MAEHSGIAWLFPQTLASFQASRVADTVRLKMTEFVAAVTKGYSVANVKAKLRKIRERQEMVSAKVSSSIVSAILAREFIAGKNSQAPSAIFCGPAIVKAALSLAMSERVMCFAARRALLSDCGDGRLCFGSMLFAEAIARARKSGCAHFCSTFRRHFRAFANHFQRASYGR